MANKQINELTEKSGILHENDLLLVYDSEEAGSEKTKKVSVENFYGDQWRLIEIRTSGDMNDTYNSVDTSAKYKMYTEITPDTPSDSFGPGCIFSGDWTDGNYVNDPSYTYNYSPANNQAGIEKYIIESVFDIPNKIIYGVCNIIKTSSGIQRNPFLIRWLSGSAVTSITNNLWVASGGGSRTGKLYKEV